MILHSTCTVWVCGGRCTDISTSWRGSAPWAQVRVGCISQWDQQSCCLLLAYPKWEPLSQSCSWLWQYNIHHHTSTVSAYSKLFVCVCGPFWLHSTHLGGGGGLELRHMLPAVAKPWDGRGEVQKVWELSTDSGAEDSRSSTQHTAI